MQEQKERGQQARNHWPVQAGKLRYERGPCYTSAPSSFHHTTPELGVEEAAEGTEGGWGGLLTKNTPTSKGGCQGSTKDTHRRVDPPKDRGRTHSPGREWGLGCQIQPAAGRWVPVNSALCPRFQQAQSEQEGTMKCLGPIAQQAVQEIRPCPL